MRHGIAMRQVDDSCCPLDMVEDRCQKFLYPWAMATIWGLWVKKDGDSGQEMQTEVISSCVTISHLFPPEFSTSHSLQILSYWHSKMSNFIPLKTLSSSNIIILFNYYPLSLCSFPVQLSGHIFSLSFSCTGSSSLCAGFLQFWRVEAAL